MNNWNTVSNFITFSTKGITPKYVEHSDVMVLNQKCIRNNRIDFSLAQFTDTGKISSDSKFIRVGDILINSTGTGTAGRCAFVSEIPKGYRLITDSHILLLRSNNYYEAKCLNYVLFSFEKTLMSFMTGSSGQSELDKVVLFGLKTKMSTDTNIQKNISIILSNLERKIELNNKINAELEAMAKLIYDYWFVQFDFPNEDGLPYKSSGGKMVWNEELKREIPEGWGVKELNDLCAKIGDGIHGTPNYVEDSEYYFINGNNLKNGYIRTDSDTKHINEEEYNKYFIELNDGTILLSINGTLGNLAVYLGEKVMLGKSSAYINCKNSYRPYCYQFLKQPHMFKLFWNLATGSTIKNLSLDSIKKLKIQVPNNNLVEEYYKRVISMDDKRKNIFKENEELSELRDWLLPILMNGQVKVETNT